MTFEKRYRKDNIQLIMKKLITTLALSAALFLAVNAQETKPVKLLYWNIQNGMWDGQGDEYQRFTDWVAKQDPDICVFCESQSNYKTDDSHRLAIEDRFLPTNWDKLAERYGHKYWGLSGYRDNFPQVVTSKYPIKFVSKIVGSQPDSVVSHGAGWMQISMDGKDFNIVTLHTWPQKYAPGATDRDESIKAAEGDWYRRLEIEYICKHTILSRENQENELWMMMGDFNSVSRLDNDFLGLPEVDTQFLVQDYVLQSTPYIDIVREKHPGETLLSTGKKNKRIDFVYCNKPMASLVNTADIIWDEYTTPTQTALSNFWRPSDHLPVILTIDTKKQIAKAQEKPNIVPMPNSYVLTGGVCSLKGFGKWSTKGLDSHSEEMVSAFCKQLKTFAGAEQGALASIGFVADTSLPKEGYAINIGAKQIAVKAADYNGFFYAVQTLKQLLPVEIYGNAVASGANWSIPCCRIEDAPRFAYRGFMLDPCRHFWTLEQTKKWIDVMAMYKLNRLHWHLTEDQGWRVEIKKYPKLTEVGAWREGTQIEKDRNSNDGIRHGGFYTQEQIREIIKYAQDRGITIVPEVDLPGHMMAALAAYPELGCVGSEPQPYKVWTKWGVSKQVLCVGKEETMKFLEDVVCELADLFPSEYFHIGGDECPRTEWASDPVCQAKIKELGLVSDEKASAEARLQNYVTARIQKVLASKGKKIIGWDEILEGELAPGATVMSWRGSKGGIKASAMGYDVIMTPNSYCYFDYAQSYDVDKEPLSISSMRARVRAIPLDRIYSWDPYVNIAPEYQKHILGAQANLWTEYIATPEYLEYMMLPRMLALSEVQWCQKQNKDIMRFRKALETRQYQVLEMLGYNFRKD